MSEFKQEYEKALEINKKAIGNLLPEEEKLLDGLKSPSPGYHVHDEDNPFGMHRHFLKDKIDGAHQHTVLTPQGRHVHGEFVGRALIDGAHYHGRHDLGYHSHKSDEPDSGRIIPQQPPSIGDFNFE